MFTSMFLYYGRKNTDVGVFCIRCSKKILHMASRTFLMPKSKMRKDGLSQSQLYFKDCGKNFRVRVNCHLDLEFWEFSYFIDIILIFFRCKNPEIECISKLQWFIFFVCLFFKYINFNIWALHLKNCENEKSSEASFHFLRGTQCRMLHLVFLKR